MNEQNITIIFKELSNLLNSSLTIIDWLLIKTVDLLTSYIRNLLAEILGSGWHTFLK